MRGGVLPIDHLAVLMDAVAVALGDVALGLGRLVLGGCPGEVISAHLDVIVGELAELVVVHAEEFGFL